MTSFAHDLQQAGISTDLIDSLIRPGSESLVDGLARACQALIRPMMQDIIEWAEANVILPPGMGYASGPFRALHYQRGMMRVWQDDMVERLIFKKVPRCGASFITAIAILYISFHEAQDVILYERSKGKAQVFWDQYISPLIDASPALAKLRRPRHLDKWHDMVLYNGAMLHFRGADDFRAVKGKWVFIEEAGDDAWLPDTGGDKFDRAANRGAAFGDGILSIASSPLLAATCQVTKAFSMSEQHSFKGLCPHCGFRQAFLTAIQPGDGQPGFYYRMDGETGEMAPWSDPVTGFVAPDIWYRCAGMGCEIREKQKHVFCESAEWMVTRPDAKVGMRRWAGFHLSAFYSGDPKSRWEHIIREYVVQLTDFSKRQTFCNERLGMEYDAENVRAVEPHWVKSKRVYAFPSPCPPCVGAATVGSDNQTGALSDEKRKRTGRIARSEVSVVGWGSQERSAVLAHIIIPHAPFSSESNEMKLRIMKTKFHLPNGDFITPAAAADDIGDGNTINAAIQFVSSKEARAVLWDGVKGMKEAWGTRAPTISSGKERHEHWQYENVRKQAAIDVLMGRLHIEGFGPGTITFPKNEEFHDGYFKSLTAVKREIKEGHDGSHWTDMDDNEAMDCWVYAYARHLLLKRNLPGVAAVFENPALDNNGEWAMEMIRERRQDRSWQSKLCEDERRVTGGLTADEYTPRRLILPAKKGAPPTLPGGSRPVHTNAPAAPPMGYGPGGARPQQQPQNQGTKYGPVGSGRRPGW